MTVLRIYLSIFCLAKRLTALLHIFFNWIFGTDSGDLSPLLTLQNVQIQKFNSSEKICQKGISLCSWTWELQACSNLGSSKVNLKVSTCHHDRLNWSQTTILHLQCDLVKDRPFSSFGKLTGSSKNERDEIGVQSSPNLEKCSDNCEFSNFCPHLVTVTFKFSTIRKFPSKVSLVKKFFIRLNLNGVQTKSAHVSFSTVKAPWNERKLNPDFQL